MLYSMSYISCKHLNDEKCLLIFWNTISLLTKYCVLDAFVTSGDAVTLYHEPFCQLAAIDDSDLLQPLCNTEIRTNRCIVKYIGFAKRE